MKTEKRSLKIKDWYKHLKQPIKNQAITNLKLFCKNIKVDNLSDAIMLGFIGKVVKKVLSIGIMFGKALKTLRVRSKKSAKEN